MVSLAKHQIWIKLSNLQQVAINASILTLPRSGMSLRDGVPGPMPSPVGRRHIDLPHGVFLSRCSASETCPISMQHKTLAHMQGTAPPLEWSPTTPTAALSDVALSSESKLRKHCHSVTRSSHSKNKEKNNNHPYRSTFCGTALSSFMAASTLFVCTQLADVLGQHTPNPSRSPKVAPDPAFEGHGGIHIL